MKIEKLPNNWFRISTTTDVIFTRKWWQFWLRKVESKEIIMSCFIKEGVCYSPQVEQLLENH